MATQGYNIRGRSFRTASDYQAALRDRQKIEAIEKRLENASVAELEKLLESLPKVKFETLLGSDFEEELEELLAQKKSSVSSRKQTKSKAKKAPKEKKKKSLEDYDEEMQRQIRYEIYQQEKNRKRMVLFCTLLATICIGYVIIYGFYYAKNSAEYERLASMKEETAEESKVHINYTQEEKKDLVILEKYKNLYNKNKSLIGWLKIDDTNIDYPVMQTSNNEYYLDHNYNQQYDKNGSLFLDKDCDITNPNTNMIIYGHHMKSGKMFGRLNLYSSKDYYEKHRLIQFDTIYEEGTYEVMYVFRSRIYNEDEVVFKYYQFFDVYTPEEFDSHMQEMAELSLYDTGVTASYGDKLITLSTCDNSEEDGRFVVVAKKVK